MTMSMTIWQPCSVGEDLYQAMWDEADVCGDTLLTLATRPAWFAWREHAENCESCRIGEKE